MAVGGEAGADDGAAAAMAAGIFPDRFFVAGGDDLVERGVFGLGRSGLGRSGGLSRGRGLFRGGWLGGLRSGAIQEDEVGFRRTGLIGLIELIGRRGSAGGAEGFLFGEEAFVEVFEGGEFGFEFGDGGAVGEGLEEAAFEQANEGGAEGARGTLADVFEGGGGLLEHNGFAGFEVVRAIEAAEGAIAGLEVESMGARLGDEVADIGVGEAVAEVDDALPVLGGELFEKAFGFHGSCVFANQS